MELVQQIPTATIIAVRRLSWGFSCLRKKSFSPWTESFTSFGCIIVFVAISSVTLLLFLPLRAWKHNLLCSEFLYQYHGFRECSQQSLLKFPCIVIPVIRVPVHSFQNNITESFWYGRIHPVGSRDLLLEYRLHQVEIGITFKRKSAWNQFIQGSSHGIDIRSNRRIFSSISSWRHKFNGSHDLVHLVISVHHRPLWQYRSPSALMFLLKWSSGLMAWYRDENIFLCAWYKPSSACTKQEQQILQAAPYFSGNHPGLFLPRIPSP